MISKFDSRRIGAVCLVGILFASTAFGVNSRITRQSTVADLQAGEIDNVVISSKGTLELGRAYEVLTKEIADVWSVNCIVVKADDIFFGTSPNGGIYKYSKGEMKKIYPLEEAEEENIAEKTSPDINTPMPAEPNDSNDVNDVEVKKVEKETYLANEHIFAMVDDGAGGIIAGISGEKCRLIRIIGDKVETIFEPNDTTKYIFSLSVVNGGDVYVGTGPEGKIFKVNPEGAEPELFYQCSDKNVLSLLAGEDGNLYAGTDEKGLVYKIDMKSGKATILYDSDQPEITALLMADDGSVYAAATSAKVAQAEMQFASKTPAAGKPEKQPNSNKPASNEGGGLKLEIANSEKGAKKAAVQAKQPKARKAEVGKVSQVFKIDSNGFVTEIFSEPAIFFSLAQQQGKLLVSSGTMGRFISVDPLTERNKVIYEDKQAAQIVTAVVIGEDIYLGTANPAGLVKIGLSYSKEGSFISDLIDAAQPSRWGKLQIDADIPSGCSVLVSSRSGNVEDANDKSFSEFSEPKEITAPVQMECPVGRFFQYKLVLKSEDGGKSPLIREIAIADSVPNIAPVVEGISSEKIAAPGKEGFFKISYKASDENNDTLIYEIDFRKIGRDNWIKIKDDVEADNYEWDSKTVEDGRYEIRVVASDEKANDALTKLTASRVSEPIVVDNTPPVVEAHSLNTENDKVTIKLMVVDEFSVVGKVEYTVDSNTKWLSALPDDLVYDTKTENFTIELDNLEEGEHVAALKVSDDAGNVGYKSIELYIEEE